MVPVVLWMQETWPHPSLDAALERAAPAPHWGGVGELVPSLAWPPGGVSVGDLAPMTWVQEGRSCPLPGQHWRVGSTLFCTGGVGMGELEGRTTQLPPRLRSRALV